MAETKYILDKNKLVRYMMQVHNDEYSGEISRIKLQKGLYFLFAFWAQNMSETVNQHTEIADLIQSESEYLFDAGFQAWAYGPVDVEVYNKHKRNELEAFTQEESNEFLRESNPVVNSYLHSMTRKIFNSSDFGLVDLSHRDKVWSDKYDPSVSYNAEVITAEEIVREYKNK